MMHKLIVVFSLLSFSLSFSIASAQMPPAPLPGPQPQPRPMQPPEKVLENFFQLNEIQMADFKNLLETRQQTMRPLAERSAELEKRWRELFASANPDPVMAGRLAVQMHSIRQQMNRVQRQFIQDFEHLLMPDQIERLQLLRRAVRLEPIINALRPLLF